MSSDAGPQAGPRQSGLVVIMSSFIGSAIEWYDFFLYGTVAALVFNQLFFPTFDPLIGTLAAFSTYAVGFVARPLGGVVFGHFGDRIGRKSMLMLTLLIMGGSTVLIGLLPTYAQVGFWAPVLLTVLRLFQGFALGGEWGGAVLVAVEHAPDGRRGFFGSWPQTGVAAGLILASLAVSAFSTLPEEAFLSWGWRIPFVMSALLILLGLFVRLKLAETPDFLKARRSGGDEKLPLVTVLREALRNVLLVIGARLGELTLFYLVAVFTLSYGTQALGMPRASLLNGLTVAATVALVMTPLAGMLADRVGHRRLYMTGAVAMLAFAFPFFWLLDTGSTLAAQAAIVIGIGFVYPLMYGPQAALFSSLFNARVRYTGISLGTQVGSIIGGGLSPILATALLAQFGASWPIALYAASMALLALVATWAMGRGDEATARTPLMAEPVAPARR
jgi:metabolite-proton symporter